MYLSTLCNPLTVSANNEESVLPYAHTQVHVPVDLPIVNNNPLLSHIYISK